MNVHVVATTPSGTRAALAAATTLGAGLDTRTTLLVPCIVPYAQELSLSTHALACTVQPFEQIAGEFDRSVEIRVCVCRPHDATLVPLLSRDTSILIGGRSRRYWPTPAQRLATSLTQKHYPVLFVEE